MSDAAAPRVPHAAARRSPPRRGLLEPYVITALFDSREAVEDAQRRLHDAGVPRDLIEVVVSQESARRFYPGAARAPGREVFRYAGVGGLVGLVLSAALSLLLLALPGEASPGRTAIVQLLGPDFGTVGGAALGAIYGALSRRRPSRSHARAAEAASAILLAVRTREEIDLETLESILAASGARDIRVE